MSLTPGMIGILPGLSSLKHVGPKARLLQLDTRAERTALNVVSNNTYKAVLAKVGGGCPGSPWHVMACCGVCDGVWGAWDE
jgi:hypothetical protein